MRTTGNPFPTRGDQETRPPAPAAHPLRVGVTDAFLNGRPRITVNDWVSAVAAAPSQLFTRSRPTGSYRRDNHTFTFSVPSSAGQTDTTKYNVLKIDIASGSTGSAYLGPGTSFDCLTCWPEPPSAGGAGQSPPQPATRTPRQ